MIPLSIPNLTGKEWQYVKECFDTNWISSTGSFVNAFEEQFAQYIGTKYAVATVNGTAALHISLILCGVTEGDEVIVPNLTFIAPVNTVRYCNADPVFMDAEWGTLGMDVEKLSGFLETACEVRDGYTYNRGSNKRVKAIIPMHTLGNPVDMDALLALCSTYNIDVIEDATESLGSEYKGKKTGNFSKLACFSFNGNKIITTGGGGMITTNDPELAKAARHLTTTAKSDGIGYIHDEIGYNYRMVNVLAAIGVAQLEEIDRFVAIKKANLIKYEQLLGDNENFYIHNETKNAGANCWMYALVSKEGSHSPTDLVKHFADHEIEVRPLWQPMNTLDIFKKYQSYHCENSTDMHSRIVNIPCSTSITEEEMIKVVEAIQSV